MGSKRNASGDARADRFDLYQHVTETIVAMLNAGTAPWDQPWDSHVGLPLSLSTRKPYRGINVFLLGWQAMSRGYVSPWWGTYDRIKELGGQVRKGEKGTLVTFWKSITKTDPDTREETKSFILRYHKVFNADQADGLPEKYHKPIERAAVEGWAHCDKITDGYLSNAGPSLTYGGNRAYYVPSLDAITVPPRDAYQTPGDHYATLWHELAHSTGHSSRLARKSLTEGCRFGDEQYSREELVAEMTVAMLCGLMGFERPVMERSASYLASWIRVLKGDSRLAVQASAAAQKAAELIIGDGGYDCADLD